MLSMTAVEMKVPSLKELKGANHIFDRDSLIF